MKMIHWWHETKLHNPLLSLKPPAKTHRHCTASRIRNEVQYSTANKMQTRKDTYYAHKRHKGRGIDTQTHSPQPHVCGLHGSGHRQHHHLLLGSDARTQGQVALASVSVGLNSTNRCEERECDEQTVSDVMKAVSDVGLRDDGDPTWV